MNRQQVIALVATLLFTIAVVLLMQFTHLSLAATDRSWPPPRQGQVSMADEELLFDVIEMPRAVTGKAEEASPAFNETSQERLSEPEPVSGADKVDAGPAGKPQPPVTSTKPSPVKKKVEPKPEKSGPSKEEQEQERATRRANTNVKGAFDRADGRNNTQNTGTTPGESGAPSGSDKSIHGRADGSANGGWVVPNYRRIPSTVTGSIIVNVVIGRDGAVTDFTFVGGKAPASTDLKLRDAVKKEIQSRRFTRSDNNARDRATARITYIFE